MKRVEIGSRIVKLRKAKGLSQRELAEKIPVATATLSRWETGSIIPPLSQIERLCEVMEIPLEAILLEEKEDNNDTKNITLGTPSRKIVTVTLLSFLVIIVLLLFIPKYQVVYEENAINDNYGNSVIVCVKPLFCFTENGAFMYGEKISKKYESDSNVDVVEIFFVKDKVSPFTEENILGSWVFFTQNSE